LKTDERELAEMFELDAVPRASGITSSSTEPVPRALHRPDERRSDGSDARSKTALTELELYRR